MLILVCLCKVYGYCCYLTSVLLIRYNWCAELLLIWLNSYWDIDYVSDGKAVRQIRQPIRIMLYKLNLAAVAMLAPVLYMGPEAWCFRVVCACPGGVIEFFRFFTLLQATVWPRIFIFLHNVMTVMTVDPLRDLHGIIYSIIVILHLPSVLWRCWLGGRKAIRPVKKLSGGVLVW